MKTETQLVHDLLAVCEYCQCAGPRARLAEHYAQDHPEIFWPAPGGGSQPSAPDFSVMIPGRFYKRLWRIHRQTHRSLGDIIASALDAQGLGRQRRPQAS